MIKQCPICGKEFNARQRNYVYCSRECGRIGNYEHHRKYHSDNLEHCRQLTLKSQRKNAKPMICKICGKIVPKYIRNGHIAWRSYHEQCVVDKALEAVKNGAKYTDKDIIRAKNVFNYSMSELKEIVEGE